LRGKGKGKLTMITVHGETIDEIAMQLGIVSLDLATEDQLRAALVSRGLEPMKQTKTAKHTRRKH
jgi:hypothetical protein